MTCNLYEKTISEKKVYKSFFYLAQKEGEYQDAPRWYYTYEPGIRERVLASIFKWVPEMNITIGNRGTYELTV